MNNLIGYHSTCYLQVQTAICIVITMLKAQCLIQSSQRYFDLKRLSTLLNGYGIRKNTFFQHQDLLSKHFKLLLTYNSDTICHS